MVVENNTWLTPELYKLGLKNAKLLYPSAPQDILHDVIADFQSRINDGKLLVQNVNKNLLFISIRNRMYSMGIKESNRYTKVDAITAELNYINDLDYSTAFDDKMYSISRVYEVFSQEDKLFFLQRFINRTPKRHMMHKLKISSEEFDIKVLELKKQIKQYYKVTYIETEND